MSDTVSSTEAARHLGDLLARVKHKGERFVLTRNERPIAELRPVAGIGRGTLDDIRAALARVPHDPDFAADLEAVNRSDQAASNPWQS